ncbi:hypothetical protein M5K25_024811 [Dendrobium thyrsiflorum]|uniref:3-beta hydroxysteroid dehydrogenase/isomerase domain-containing protein n=1 Tax=Dendrobium thyrsiflorum TaxID=117978 RepID=A0ABD0U7S3_DENTH
MSDSLMFSITDGEPPLNIGMLRSNVGREKWYCLSKTMAEREAFKLAQENGLDVVTLCPSLVFGPLLQSNVNYSSLLLINFLKGSPELIETSRSGAFVDVRDVADALLLVYETPNASGRYICSLNQMQYTDLIDMLKNMYPSFKYPNNIPDKNEANDLSSEKLKKIGWKCRTLKETIDDSVKYYQEVTRRNSPSPIKDKEAKANTFQDKDMNRILILSNGSEKNAHLRKMDKAAENLQLFKADLLDYNAIEAAIFGCEGVFHVASPVILSGISNPEVELIRPALLGTRNIFKACSKTNIKRVVVVSSNAAIAINPDWPHGTIMDERCWLDEDFCRESEVIIFLYFHIRGVFLSISDIIG